MKKKVVLSVAAAALIGTLAVGGTLAWFTDTETATNVVTTGNVNVSWFEKGEKDDDFKEIKPVEDENGNTVPGGIKVDEDVVPGKSMEKKAYVENMGKNDAYIRAKIIVTISQNGDDMRIPEDATQVGEHEYDWYGLGYVDIEGMDKNSWLYEDDGYFYFIGTLDEKKGKGVVSPGKATGYIMDSVKLNIERFNNDFANKGINITLEAEAIQADNIVEKGEAISPQKAFEIVTKGNTLEIPDYEDRKNP